IATGFTPAMPDDHISISKPKSPDSELYLSVKKFIKECLKTTVRLKDDSNGTVYLGEIPIHEH
ncbi:MAG: hypothetical protein F6K37_41020, partial [Moorea sp. SIO4E2]|nr:hypothetical protein [Moorena sp. SIO4E2]